MESKKINQLATELTPALSDLTIIGDPTTGISKKITLSQMASLFTGTVEEYANLASFPLVGVADTIYIALDTNVLYRWDTTLTSYVELSPNIINSLVFNDANGFDGTISLVGSVATLTITTALTTGSVGFIGASGALVQDNANFFWDDTNNRLGIGTNAPTTAIDAFGSGIIGRLNGTSTNNSFLGFASAGTNKWSIGNVQSDHRFRIYSEANTAELVSVLQTGEFGIGIANPTTKLHIDGGASALIANLDANVSVAKSISFRSDNSARINLEVSGTESGSNAGADLFIRRYSDAGALIDTPLTITRSTGNAFFNNNVSIGVAFVSGTGNLQVGGTANASLFAQQGTDTVRMGVRATGRTGIVFDSSDTTYTSRMWYIDNVGANGSLTIGRSGLDVLSFNNSGAATFSSTVSATQYTATSSGGSGLRVYGGSGTNQWDMYLNGANLRFSDNTGTGSFVVDRPATFSSTVSATTGITGATIKLTGFTNYGTINDANDVRRIWFENTGSYRTLFDLPASGTSFSFRKNDGTTLMNIASNALISLYGDVQLPTGNYVQWLAYSDANSRTWALRNNETEIGDFAISSSVNNSNTLSAVRLRITRNGEFQVKGTGTLLLDGSSNNLIRTAGNSNLSLYASNNGTSGTGEMGFYTADTLRMRIFYDGYMALNSVVFNTTTSGTVRTLYIGTGAGYLLGGISSIRRSKKNIENVSNIDWLYQLNPVTFNYRKLDENKNYTEEVYEDINYGLIAEDTAPIADFLINYNEQKEGIKEMIGIEYPRLIIPLLKAVQELKAEIDILKAK